MVKPESERLCTTYASDENLDTARPALRRKRRKSVNTISSQTSLTIQETPVVYPYNFVYPAVSSSDRIIKPKFKQLHTYQPGLYQGERWRSIVHF